ncbi:MAG: hypothetical protein JHD16_15555 [Solirubrobacteraceae bacterium]|nr:hypothetical protein [Solirubrobacteraceae bacterium]
MSVPPPPPDERELADTIPGAVSHDVYAGGWRAGETPPGGLPPLSPPPPTRPSAWNAPAFGMLAIFLLALGALLWPQYRARAVENKIQPVVAGLSQRDTSARCPRYITAIFTNVGSVSLDASGNPGDRTDLTGPICDALRHLYTDEGRAELQCLVTDGRCPESARRSIVALSVVAHESMHLRGILDEAAAECSAIAEGPRTAKLAGLTPEQGRMIGYLHLMALNPNTPDEYAVSPGNCRAARELTDNPPGTEAQRGLLVMLTEQTWTTLGE